MTQRCTAQRAMQMGGDSVSCAGVEGLSGRSRGSSLSEGSSREGARGSSGSDLVVFGEDWLRKARGIGSLEDRLRGTVSDILQHHQRCGAGGHSHGRGEATGPAPCMGCLHGVRGMSPTRLSPTKGTN